MRGRPQPRRLRHERRHKRPLGVRHVACIAPGGPQITRAGDFSPGHPWRRRVSQTYEITDLLKSLNLFSGQPLRCGSRRRRAVRAQVDFAHFRTVFTDEPDVERVVWLFSLMLGHSRMLWGRFVPQQDMQTVLRKDRLVGPGNPHRVLSLQCTGFSYPSCRHLPGALDDRELLPYSRDVTLREDASRIQSNRVRQAPQLRIQHPQGKPHRNNASGPLSRSSQRHQASTQNSLSNNSVEQPWPCRTRSFTRRCRTPTAGRHRCRPVRRALPPRQTECVLPRHPEDKARSRRP